ncbi:MULTISPECIES: hypothetical protein [unclassified Streptomyces]|uniref:hypothetical protein n=1 Tax=unclassified Streptomyces TaxID=2593676 RepID=UPI0019251DF4|nr:MULTISPECIES: hypothetical protein [unclassified Streptomyces]
MAAVPGLAFAGSPGVVREAVPGWADRPDESYGSPMWPTAEGSTSATPASRHVPFDVGGADLIARVWEALELPGSAMDYHFVLQSAVERLWGARRAEPEALAALEVFALLDLDLMEAAPHAVSFKTAATAVKFVQVSSVPRLIALLEREGAFGEALAVARRLVRFGQGENVVVRLEEKARALVTEAAAQGGSA